MVQNGRTLEDVNFRSGEAHVVQSCIVQQHALGRADGNQDSVVGHHRVGHFRERDAEESAHDAMGLLHAHAYDVQHGVVELDTFSVSGPRPS